MHIKESFLGGRTIYEVGDKTFYIRSRAEAYARSHGRSNPARVVSKTVRTSRATPAPYGVAESVRRSTDANRKILRDLKAGKMHGIKWPRDFLNWLGTATVTLGSELGMSKKAIAAAQVFTPRAEAMLMMKPKNRFSESAEEYNLTSMYEKWLRGESHTSIWPDIRRVWRGVRSSERKAERLFREDVKFFGTGPSLPLTFSSRLRLNPTGRKVPEGMVAIGPRSITMWREMGDRPKFQTEDGRIFTSERAAQAHNRTLGPRLVDAKTYAKYQRISEKYRDMDGGDPYGFDTEDYAARIQAERRRY